MSDSSPHTLSHQAGSAAARLSFTAGVCVFVGCNWPLLWPPTPHVFLIATTDLSVVKLKRCSASGPKTSLLQRYVPHLSPFARQSRKVYL